MIDKAIEYIKEFFSKDSSGHDDTHTIRVYQLATRIAKQEKADILIVQLAALLHDVDDIKLSPKTHSTKKNAVDFMIENKVKPEIIEKVCKIIGAIGIARAFAYGGSRGRKIYDPDVKPVIGMNKEEYLKKQDSTSINHFYEKLLLLKDMMNTDAGKKMAEHRQEVMEVFLEEFMAEWNGEK